MCLASLSNIPNDGPTLQVFTFTNQDEHTKIHLAIQRIFQVSVQEYILDPLPADRGTWLLNHQAAHNQQNAILGIQGQDLTDVDFDQPSQLSAWIYQHAFEHQQAAQILRLN